MNTYQYNPHRHVKIWLSNNCTLFMNLENQIRLNKMRVMNASDIIHLIYDSSLLNSKAIQELVHYCKEHRIIAVDAQQLTHLPLSDNERRLFHFYNDEIKNLNQGGNLAVASDILRWLSPIYNLGTYSDFDYPIDTRGLSEAMNVSAPLLLNIGSLKMGSKEFILSNNDFIAVVNEQAATTLIEKVQANLLNKLEYYDTNFIEETEKQFHDNVVSRHIIRFMKNRPETLYIAKSKDLKKHSAFTNTIKETASSLNSSRNHRNYIQQIMSNNDSFLRFNKQAQESATDTIQRLKNDLKNHLNLVKYLFFNKEYIEIKHILHCNDDELLTYVRNKELNLYLKSIIVCTTGPLEIANALFGNYVLKHHEFINKVQPLSFNHYQLQRAFKTPNSIPLHESPLGMMKFLGVNEGEVNDTSWLESGKLLQDERIKKLKIQKEHFSETLSNSLLTIKKDIEHHLNKPIMNLFKKHKETQKQLLNDVLTCFHEEPEHQFDVERFQAILLNNHNDLITNLYFSPTKKLIKNLEQLSHDAVVFGLTRQRKIIINTQQGAMISH